MSIAERYGSRITRRMVALFVACALLPVAPRNRKSVISVVKATPNARSAPRYAIKG